MSWVTRLSNIGLLIVVMILMTSCGGEKSIQNNPSKKASDILGNPSFLAISYGGYRTHTRDDQPTIDELKEDMKILSAMNVGILRTYNTKLKQASNLLKAIKELKAEDPNFEMYVMLGAWIDCKDAWTAAPNHDDENEIENAAEVQRAVKLANEYPDIVKIIAVGNEAMVTWAASYFVKPRIILKYVNQLQNLKKEGKLPKDLWITSSDNYASWGGESASYHVEDLEKLIRAVDYVSLHTYPMHETHYEPEFWGFRNDEKDLTKLQKIDAAMSRAKQRAIQQYQSTADYIKGLGVTKDIHIGETGWSSRSNGVYGSDGSGATDEYKAGIFYHHMRDWTNEHGISCFYFEAFDESWKDANNANGSENHFGLFTIDGKAKYALWNAVDQGRFEGLTRGGNSITKTYGGNKDSLMSETWPIVPQKFARNAE